MKFSPTITLALALAVGMAGAAAAQTTAPTAATPDSPQPAQSVQAPTPAGQPAAAPAQPQGAAAQPGAGQQTAPPTWSPMQAGQGGEAGGSEQVRYAQERLAAMGLYKGSVNGMMDPDTRAALANFQQQHGLKRTSDLDRETYDRLTASAGRATGVGSGMPANPPAAGATQPSGAAPSGAGGNNPATPATTR